MNYNEMLDYLKEKDLTMQRYEREGFDDFISKIKFKINFPFIHVAGSNGKGSTVHFLENIYLAAGYKVASYKSPYGYLPNEMIRYNGSEISDEDFVSIFNEHKNYFDKYDLSSFEIETFIAFKYFSMKEVDVAIIECGMGGEIDATNILDATPLLSIITTISLEHTAFLGTTTSEIASSVSGIIKDKHPVLVGKLDESALSLLRNVTNKRGGKFYLVDDFHNNHYASPYFRFDYRPYTDLALLTSASYQLLNASIAVEATKILAETLPINEDAVRRGLMCKPLPVRLEKHRNVIIDGAHNYEAIDALMKNIWNIGLGKPVHCVFASYRDKNISAILPKIANYVSDIALTTFPDERARNEMDYFLYIDDYRYVEDYRFAIQDILAKYPDDIILVTGSLAFAYLVKRFVEEELKI